MPIESRQARPSSNELVIEVVRLFPPVGTEDCRHLALLVERGIRYVAKKVDRNYELRGCPMSRAEDWVFVAGWCCN